MLQQIQNYAIELEKQGKSAEEISATIGKELPQLLKTFHPVLAEEIQKQWSPEFI
jgi:hypothetical protein